MQSCKLYLVRHGESVANRDGIIGGNSPLTELGCAQAEATKKELEHIKFDAVYSSDLVRASKTAQIVSGHPVPKARQLPDLRERSFGRYEEDSVAWWMGVNRDYEQRYGSLPFAERSQYDYADTIESDAVMLKRFIQALNSIAKDHAGQQVLVAAHGGPIRMILMDLGYADMVTAGSFQNAGYVELVGDGHSLRIEKVVGVTKSVNAE